MKEVFYELIKEASTGKVSLDGEFWTTKFDTRIMQDGKIIYDSINDNSKISLVIKDEERFFKLLREYLDLELEKNRKSIKLYSKNTQEEKEKVLIFNLLANATTEDFINPEELIRRNIGFLKDNTFSNIEEPINVALGNNFLNSTLEIQDELSDTRMETPHKIKMKLKKEIDGEKVEYVLPTIYYGITEENNKKVCYIYSIINPKNKKEQSSISKKYNSKINRLLFKLNEGIKEKESNEYYEYKEGKSNYYPEGNITDVTMSFILSLNIFMTLLQSKKITDIKVVPYLPMRYISREVSAVNVDDEERKRSLLARNNEIQQNLTNKFIRTFLRLQAQNSEISINLYPYELDEYLHVHLDTKNKELDNMLLEETNKPDVYSDRFVR